MKKVETHLHVVPIGTCPIETPRDTARLYKNAGYDVLIVTNHFQKKTINDMRSEGKDPIAEYVNAYREVKKYGEKVGLEVWFGVEVALETTGCNAEFLLYGVDEDFILSNPDMINYTQAELYKKVQEAGAIMVQAHPYRSNTALCDLEYMDGIEAFNLHPNHTQPYPEFVSMARASGKIITSGSDFHFRGGEALGGVIVGDEVKNINDFVNALKKGEYELILTDAVKCF